MGGGPSWGLITPVRVRFYQATITSTINRRERAQVQVYKCLSAARRVVRYVMVGYDTAPLIPLAPPPPPFWT